MEGGDEHHCWGTKTPLLGRSNPTGWLTTGQTLPWGKAACGGLRRGEVETSNPPCCFDHLTNSAFPALQLSAELLDLLDGTDRHECNCCQLCCQPVRPLRAAAWVLRPRLKQAASAPVQAPYWRRRGLALQIISPPPPCEPLSAPGQTTVQALHSSPSLLSVPICEGQETTGAQTAHARSPNHNMRGFKV